MGDLERLHELKKQGYRVTEIKFEFDKDKTPSATATVWFRRNSDVQEIVSSEESFISYVTHLHSIPHIEDDNSDFVYVDNPNEFFEVQEKILDMFSGERKQFEICEQHIDKEYQSFTKKIKVYQREWVLSERNFRFYGTKLCEIFNRVWVHFLRGTLEDFELLEKDRLNLSDIQSLLQKSKECDVAVCSSAFLLAPKFPANEKGHDLIVGLITYDLKNQRTLAVNLNTLTQLQRRISGVGHQGLWECVFELCGRISDENSFISYLPLPLDIRDFTPLPWFCYAFLRGIQNGFSVKDFTFDFPLFLAFGSPLLLLGKPSYVFKPEEQTAFLMLDFREGKEVSCHQLRFDVSRGEPVLHLDYEIYYDARPSEKVVSHHTVDYKDIWDFSENLAIGFLAASAYDVRFDTVIIPKSLGGVKEAFKENPSSIYPLFVRSMAAKPYRLLKERTEKSEALRRIANGKQLTDSEELTLELEEMGLIREGKLTILGNIVHARLRQ